MPSIKKIAQYVDGDIFGDSNLIIKGLCGIDNGKEKHITYIYEKQYFKYFLTTQASAIIINHYDDFPLTSKTLIKVENSIKSFSKLIDLFYEKEQINPSIKKNAIINKNVKLGINVYIGENVVIDEDVFIGNDVCIKSGSYIGKNCIIGDNSIISSNVTLIKNVKIGTKVKINSGTVIGGAGFGLITEDKKHSKIPHFGDVLIGNNVSIGSNCCIDRGTINNTEVGDNTQIDNLVQVAHNVKIGKSCIIAGQSGVAGSTIIGNFVTIGGQVGIVGHIEISDNVTIAGKSLVTKSMSSDQTISGIPAKDHKQRIKQEAVINRLPNIIKNIKK